MTLALTADILSDAAYHGRLYQTMRTKLYLNDVTITTQSRVTHSFMVIARGHAWASCRNSRQSISHADGKSGAFRYVMLLILYKLTLCLLSLISYHSPYSCYILTRQTD